MARIYISIGSNIEAEKHLRRAVAELTQLYGKLQLSSVYESEAVGFDGDNFLNMVVGLDTEEDVHQVVQTLRQIEDRHGRVRSGPRFSARTMDLDLLLYDALVLKENGFELPREEITQNAFVLWPLAEIAPDLIHPSEHQSMATLWQDFDKDSQKLWPITITWQL
jgi:2-amino-4-hydroxy-6-hydroxymethyldihydropteridine diphosphokinase